MNEKIRKNKAIAAVCLALVLVLLLVIGVFVFGQPSASHVQITLPEPQETEEHEKTEADLSENSLLQVTPENAALALQSLKRPEFYHQTFSVRVGEDELAKETLVDIWVNGNFKRAQVSTQSETKILLTNGSAVYLWYDGEDRPVHIKLSDHVTFEDILGLPAFDYLQTVQEGNVTDAEYLVLEEETEIPCIFLSMKHSDGAASRYWVDLTTGLLYEADSVEGNTQVYHVRQTAFDRLVDGDESFADKFLLPDGSGAFTAGTNTQQQQ